MRIQKFLSQCGYCSRRKAEDLIQEQVVTINGHVAQIGQTIDPDKDVVKVEGRRIKSQKSPLIVLLLNKPRGVLCSHNDPHLSGKTVFDFIPTSFARSRFLFCGRLDKESQGMLILTNDGEFANKLTHPSSNISKIYRVTLSLPLSQEQYSLMTQGILDDGELLKADKVYKLDSKSEKQVLEIHLKQGRKREIRRMIEFLGSHVHRLNRIQIGQLKLKNLPVGSIRQLDEKEISLLFR